MIISTRFVTVVMAAVGFVGLGLGTGTASAESANGGMVPLARIFDPAISPRSATSRCHRLGPGTSAYRYGSNVTADVFLTIGTPNTPYQVRLIQGPRPGSQKCIAGDPGVASAVLNTDGNGVGSLTLQRRSVSGATNAWVFLDGPPEPGQIRGEFYTSEFLTSLK